MANEEDTLNKKMIYLTNLIDAEICSHYKCWPNNYIAYDILSNTREYETFYTKAEEEIFREYRESELKELEKDGNTARELFLKIYTNPVINLNRSK
jgi:hypothetical protein